MSLKCLDTFLKEIGLSEPKNLTEPEDEVQPDETVVGTLDDDLRRFYSMSLQLAYQIQDAARPQWWQLLNPNGLKMPVGRAASLVDLLNKLFWIEINDRLQLWDKPCIGIRKGWQVVWFDNKARRDKHLRDLRHLRDLHEVLMKTLEDIE